MKKWVRLSTIFLLLLSVTENTRAYCQKFYLSDIVTQAVSSHCPVCKRVIYQHGQPAGSQREFSITEVAYHNALDLLKRGEVDSGYQCLNTFIIREAENDDTLLNIATFLKAKIFFYKSLYQEALHLYLPLLDKRKLDEVVKENVCTNIAEIHLEQSRFKEALAFFTLWQQTYKRVSNVNSIKSVYCNIGLCYLHTKAFTKANRYFKESIRIAKQLKDTSGLAILYENIANQYYNQYFDTKASAYFLQALFFAKRSENIKAQMNIYGSLSAVEENRKNFYQSLNYLKQYIFLNERLFKRDDIYNLMQKEKQQAIKEKEQRIKIAEQANRLQSLELSKNNLRLSKQQQLLFFLTFIAVTFLFFFGFAFYAYRQKNKQNKTITAQRKQLDALNRTKDRLFSIVAHDLRSPVQTLKVTLIKLRTALSDKDTSRAEQVVGETEAVTNSIYALLNNLLYWALSQTGRLHLANDKLNMKRLVDQVLHDYVPIAAAKNITLENRVKESLHCCGDMNTVKIILRNLVDNAVKFSEPFSPVVVSGTEESKDCIVSVTDSGKGIAAAIIDSLADVNTKRVESECIKSHSTGIGLWLVKTMAEKNGGSLQIQSETKGTRMNVHLPKRRNYAQTQNTYR